MIDGKLKKVLEGIKEVADSGINAGVVTPQSLDLVERIGKVLGNVTDLIIDPPVVNKPDMELHKKESTFMPRQPEKKRGRPKK